MHSPDIPDRSYREALGKDPSQLQIALGRTLFMSPESGDTLARLYLREANTTPSFRAGVLDAMTKERAGLLFVTAAWERNTLVNVIEAENLIGFTEDMVVLRAYMQDTFPYLFGINGGLFNRSDESSAWRMEQERNMFKVITDTDVRTKMTQQFSALYGVPMF